MTYQNPECFSTHYMTCLQFRFFAFCFSYLLSEAISCMTAFFINPFPAIHIKRNVMKGNLDRDIIKNSILLECLRQHSPGKLPKVVRLNHHNLKPLSIEVARNPMSRKTKRHRIWKPVEGHHGKSISQGPSPTGETGNEVNFLKYCTKWNVKLKYNLNKFDVQMGLVEKIDCDERRSDDCKKIK